MHQKNNASGGDSQEDNSGAGDDGDRPGSRDASGQQRRDPFADDEEDDDDGDNMDSDDEDGGLGGGGGSWRSSVRGTWWRGMVRRQNERFEGVDDSDSDQGEADDDDEFGDFAMPEAEAAPGTDSNEKVLLKPLALHPPAAGSSSGYAKTPFTGLWPFGPREEKTEGGEKDEDKGKGKESETGGEEKRGEKRPEEGKDSAGVSGVSAGMEQGEQVQAAVEAKRRTSIEDPEEDEVVVQKP